MQLQTIAVGFFFLAAAGLAQGQSTLIAGWNFNDSNLTVDHGAGSLTTSGLGTEAFLLVGSSQNLSGGDASGNSLSYAGTAANNGGTAIFQFATTGLLAPTLTYAIGALVGGFTAVQWAYSTDGSGYTNFGSALTIPTISSTADLALMATRTLDLSSVSALGNQAAVYLRSTFGGASLPSTLVMDNVQISAVPEPAPTAVLCGALGLLLAGARRRRA